MENVAIILAGEYRTFDTAIKYFNNLVSDEELNVKFFISTWDRFENKDINLDDFYQNDILTKDNSQILLSNLDKFADEYINVYQKNIEEHLREVYRPHMALTYHLKSACEMITKSNFNPTKIFVARTDTIYAGNIPLVLKNSFREDELFVYGVSFDENVQKQITDDLFIFGSSVTISKLIDNMITFESLVGHEYWVELANSLNIDLKRVEVLNSGTVNPIIVRTSVKKYLEDNNIENVNQLTIDKIKHLESFRNIER
jgi:hypothetical protein